MQDVPWNDVASLNFNDFTISKDDSLKSQGFLEFINDGTRLKLLKKADGRVEDKKATDDPEIDPVPKTGSQDRSSLDIVISVRY